MVLNKYKIAISLWLENIFKYKHGYSKNCSVNKSKKCSVCKTPWPKLNKTITEKYLESINYYDRYEWVYFPPNKGDGLSYVGGIFEGGYLRLPKGMTGEELINIAKLLKPQYDSLTKGKGEEEVKKRGALEGYGEEANIKS